MKKKHVINLIRCYVEGDDSGFRIVARQIATELDKAGDTELAGYILALLGNINTFTPQVEEGDF